MRGMATTDDILATMRRINAAREKAIGPLAEIMADRQQLLDALADTEAPYAQAYTAASAAGWTATELTALGAEAPAVRAKGRPRKRRTGVSESASPAETIPAQDRAAATATEADSTAAA